MQRREMPRRSAGARVLLAGTVLAWSLLALPAMADLTRWSLGPHVGWVRNTESEENNFRKENAFTVGLASRFKLVEILAAELAVDWRTEEIEQGEVKTMPVQLSGLLYVIPPYVHGTLGVGWYRVDASLEGLGGTLKELDDEASDAGLHLGAGLELPLGSRTSLTTEGRYVFLGYELEEADEAIQVDADFFNLLVGLQFYVW